MIRIIAVVAYLAIGVGVVAVEQKRHPQEMTTGVYAWVVVMWPALPAGRLYQRVFPDRAE